MLKLITAKNFDFRSTSLFRFSPDSAFLDHGPSLLAARCSPPAQRFLPSASPQLAMKLNVRLRECTTRDELADALQVPLAAVLDLVLASLAGSGTSRGDVRGGAGSRYEAPNRRQSQEGSLVDE